MSLETKPSKPRVILGLMVFGPEVEFTARVTDFSAFTTILDNFQAAGYNEVDTARGYAGGKQEAFTRKAGWKERGLKLATKVYPKPPGGPKEDGLTERFELSLKELGTDCVDIFYLHAPDRAVPFTKTLEEVDKLHKQGKFLQLGISNFAAFEVAEIVMTCEKNGWVRPTIYQGMYNVITRSLEHELIPACKRYGLDVVVYNPIAGGLFSGKYKTKDNFPTDSTFGGAVGSIYKGYYFKDSAFEALKIIEPLAEKHGFSMVEIALRWLVHHSALNITGGNDGVVIGVSKLEQLEQNLKDCEKGPLPEDVVQALDKAWFVSKSETPDYWHGKLEYGYDTKEALFGPK